MSNRWNANNTQQTLPSIPSLLDDNFASQQPSLYNNNKSNNVSSNSNNQSAPPSMPKASGAPMQQPQLQQLSQNAADDVSWTLSVLPVHETNLTTQTLFRSASSAHRRLVIQMTMTVIPTRTAARAPPPFSRHSTIWWTAPTATMQWCLTTTITTKKVSSWWIELSCRLTSEPDYRSGWKPQFRNYTVTLHCSTASLCFSNSSIGAEHWRTHG